MQSVLTNSEDEPNCIVCHTMFRPPRYAKPGGYIQKCHFCNETVWLLLEGDQNGNGAPLWVNVLIDKARQMGIEI